MVFRPFNLFVYALSRLWPRRRERIVFGAWLGHQYTDNSRHLFEYVREHYPNWEVYWCGREEVRERVPPDAFIRYGSFRAFLRILTAKYVFITHGFKDVAYFNLTNGAVTTYLGHGLTLKHMGARISDGRGPVAWIKRLLRYADRYDYVLASSLEHQNKMLTEFLGHGICAEKILMIGSPRNDFLIRCSEEFRLERIRESFCQEFDLPLGKRIVTYMPTHRSTRPEIFSFMRLEGERRAKLAEVLRANNAIIVEKQHFFGSGVRGESGAVEPNDVIDIGTTSGVDAQQLLLITDLLVTDYSGCFFDYLLLDRPVLHYVYDHELYANQDRGLYYDLEDVSGGERIESFESLLESLRAHLADPTLGREHRARMRQRMLSAEDGAACAAVCRSVLERESNRQAPPTESSSTRLPTC